MMTKISDNNDIIVVLRVRMFPCRLNQPRNLSYSRSEKRRDHNDQDDHNLIPAIRLWPRPSAAESLVRWVRCGVMWTDIASLVIRIIRKVMHIDDDYDEQKKTLCDRC